MIIELVYIEAGEWIVQSVLDGNDLTSKKYQEKYSSYSKTRTWWMDQLIEYPTEKEMKLQRYIQSLHQELQVAHENKVSLQEALTEANKQAKVDDSKTVKSEKLKEVLKAQAQLQEEKQIITEDNEKLRATVAYNEVYITEIEEEKRQLEEQYLIDKQITKELKAKVTVNDVYITELEEENEKLEIKYRQEKQITKELKSKVADNELYTAKLMKEREQWSQIKETSTIGLQFNYLIPSMDNLDCLSDVQVAEKKLFLIQGEKAQLMNWEKYGVRIGVEEGSLLSSETVEAAVVTLVGGQFEFPANTVLVSAVYAVSLSKPLLKRLKLEIQHCVDLTGRPGVSRYLKFAIAPVSTPSLPYQFSIVKGGEFRSNSGYGSIQRKEFCLVCILGEESTNGGGDGVPIASVNGDTEEGEEEQQPQQGEEEEGEESEYQEEQDEEGDKEGGDDDDDDSDSDNTSSTPAGASGACKESTTKETNLPTNTVSVAGPTTTPNTDHVNKVLQSTGVKEATTYAGLIYYEEKGVEDLVTFAAARDLNALIEFIKSDFPRAERGQHVYFCFKDNDGYIELQFGTPQDEPITGWDIKPHMKPCRLRRCDVNKFGETNYPLPPSCLISVYGSPDAVPTLHYSIPLEGVADPVSLYIRRSLQRNPPPPPSTDPTTSSSSSNVVHESTSVSSTGGASPSATVDVNKVKKVINDVLLSHYAALNSLPKKSLTGLANQLYTAKLISNEVRETPSMEECIDEFKASLSFMREVSQVEEHCQQFLSSFVAVRGSYAKAAKFLGEDWIEAIKNELGLDFNIDIDA